MTSVTDGRGPSRSASAGKATQKVAAKLAQGEGEVKREASSKGSAKADEYETASMVASKAAKAAKGLKLLSGISNHPKAAKVASRVAGAAVGAVAEALGKPEVVAHAGKVGAVARKVLDSKVIKGAAIAAVGYSLYKDLSEKGVSTGARLANAAATTAVSAATFLPGVGHVVLAAELLSGGGVTGGAKGLAALAKLAITGDPTALDRWKADARAGEHGWVVRMGAEAVDAASATVQLGWASLSSW